MTATCFAEEDDFHEPLCSKSHSKKDNEADATLDLNLVDYIFTATFKSTLQMYWEASAKLILECG